MKVAYDLSDNGYVSDIEVWSEKKLLEMATRLNGEG